VGTLGQCTHCTKTPLRSRTRKRVLGCKGRTGKGGGAIALPSSLLGEDRRGAATLSSDPCGDERDKAGEDYVMLCPIRENTCVYIHIYIYIYIFMCKIQDPQYIGGHTNPKGGEGGQEDTICI